MIRSLLLPLGLVFAHSVAAQPLVLTSSPILLDLVQQVGADSVRAECLVPAGTRSPDFEPTPEAARRLAEAQLLVVNGAGYEPWLNDLLKQSGYEGPVIVATQGLALLDADGQWHEPADETAASQVDLDPYAWQDPQNLVRYVGNIGGALTSLLPARAGAFQIRIAALGRELRSLQDYARSQFAALPRDRRRMATSLTAFNYLAAAYGLQIVPIPGLASGQELRPAVLEHMLVGITQLHVPAVFFESTANVRTVKRIADETRTKVITTLRSDDLGPAGSPTATCIGMLRANIDAIISALK
ncbi:MAG TPA: metal ABC transporter substrate-binding protein [Opitutaceae bacterium]|nr:metal ABC transporter substrate-binding protein [Opitutaceae bacterium]